MILAIHRGLQAPPVVRDHGERENGDPPRSGFNGARSAGVEFIDENGGGPGVRLRKPPKQKR